MPRECTPSGSGGLSCRDDHEGRRWAIRPRADSHRATGRPGYECSGCRRRTWQVRDRTDRRWDDLPWAEHSVTQVYQQRRVCCLWTSPRGRRAGSLRMAEGVALATTARDGKVRRHAGEPLRWHRGILRSSGSLRYGRVAEHDHEVVLRRARGMHDEASAPETRGATARLGSIIPETWCNSFSSIRVIA